MLRNMIRVLLLLLHFIHSLESRNSNNCIKLEVNSLSDLVGKSFRPKPCLTININGNGNLETLSLSKFKTSSSLLTQLRITGGRLLIDPSFFKQFRRSLDIISLENNNIASISNHVFDGLILRQLELRSNKITIFSSAFYNCSIYNLDLKHNQIDHLCVDTFSHTRLFHVNIANNSISLIEPHSFPSSVKSIRLNHNLLSSITKNIFSNLYNLESLCLAHNRIKYIDFNDNHLEKLEDLDISFNFINNLDHAGFSSFINLKRLNLRNNPIKLISSSVQVSTLTVLDISFNFFTNFPRSHLPKSLQVIYVFGNPWNCKCLFELEASFPGSVVSNSTDCNLSNSEDSAICISYGEVCNNDTNNTLIAAFSEEVSQYSNDCRDLLKNIIYEYEH